MSCGGASLRSVSDGKSGMVLRFERSSIHDGDGFRTVVFLKGCPLRCLWCSTPEGLGFTTEMIDGKTYGSVMGVEQVMAEVRKDSVFYFHSGGGLTISGGEPLAQVDFTSNLLKHAKDENINTAIETSLSVPYKQVGKVIPYLDIIYSDLKHIDPVKHKKYCGIDNSVILDNIRRVDGLAKDFKFVIRIPIIPGINDDSATLRGVGQFCASLRNLKHVQPLAYHRLGLETYRKMGKSYPLPTTSVPTSDHMDACRAILMEFVQVDAN